MTTAQPIETHSGPPEEAGQPAPAVGRIVGRGISINIVLSLGIKVIGLVSQAVVAWLLAPEDFGIYAKALVLAEMVRIVRDAGSSDWLVHHGQAGVGRWVGSVFWLSACWNVCAALLLAAAAQPVARLYDEPRLVPMLLIVALSVPLHTVGTVLSAKMRAEMRFTAAASSAAGSSFIRYVGVVVFAALGFGPLSFVLPFPLMTLFESVWLWRVSRAHPWTERAEPARWGSILKASRWVMLLTAASSLINIGDYAALSKIVNDRVLGLYFFAYQLVAQTGSLLAHNIAQVLFPAFSSLAHDPPRMRAAVIRSLRALMLVSAPTSVVMGVVITPMEALIWQGKYAEAIPAVIAFSLLYPHRACMVLPQSAMLAQGRFRGNSFMSIVVGLGTSLSAAFAGLTWGTAPAIAACSGLASLGLCIVSCVWALGRVGLGAADVLRSTMPSWALAGALGIVLIVADRELLLEQHPAVRLMTLGFAYGVLFTLAVRFLTPNHLREVIEAAPAFARARAKKWLALGP